MHDLLWNICIIEYFPRNLRIRSAVTKLQYKYACNDLAVFLGRPATIDDLNDDTFIMWLNWLNLERGLAEISANERAGRIRALWTWLAKRGRVKTFPTVGRLSVPETVPLAWSAEELRALFEAAAKMPGFVGPFRASDWWTGLLAWLWNTGERIGATLDMEWEMIDLPRCVASLPAKIRKQRQKAATYHLWPDVVELLRRIQRPEGRVFPWHLTEASYYHHYDRLLRIARLPSGRKRKSHAIRVSHATWVQAMGGDATKDLMHSDAAITRAHYLDKRFLPHANVPLFRPWAG